MLSDSDLRKLTGRTQPAAQARWLQRHGWRFTVNALGKPVVALAEFNRRMIGGSAARKEPDWGALNGPQAHAR